MRGLAEGEQTMVTLMEVEFAVVVVDVVGRWLLVRRYGMNKLNEEWFART